MREMGRSATAEEVRGYARAKLVAKHGEGWVEAWRPRYVPDDLGAERHARVEAAWQALAGAFHAAKLVASETGFEGEELGVFVRACAPLLPSASLDKDPGGAPLSARTLFIVNALEPETKSTDAAALFILFGPWEVSGTGSAKDHFDREVDAMRKALAPARARWAEVLRKLKARLQGPKTSS